MHLPNRRRSITASVALVSLLAVALARGGEPTPVVAPSDAPDERAHELTFRVEKVTAEASILGQFNEPQRRLLEKLNRSDVQHLPRQQAVVIPSRWDLDELEYSPLPAHCGWAGPYAKALVVEQRWQVFGAYEHGRLVRWGPVSSGRQSVPTPPGSFHLNWRTTGRHSTVNRNWFMRWYFNFENERGLSFHAYELPGHPESHACIRLLERDAKWLFEWGEGWELGPRGQEVTKPGTPVLILGRYDFAAPPPWRSPQDLGRRVELPAPSSPTE